MKKYLYLIIGFFIAFITIGLVEYINSLIYPFPENFDYNNLNAIMEFSKSLPNQVFINVILGWILGTLLSSYFIYKTTKDENLIYLNAFILTIMAIINNFIILPGVHPIWFHFIGLPIFIITSFTFINFIKR